MPHCQTHHVDVHISPPSEHHAKIMPGFVPGGARQNAAQKSMGNLMRWVLDLFAPVMK
jgi:hypothetical protein